MKMVRSYFQATPVNRFSLLLILFLLPCALTVQAGGPFWAGTIELKKDVYSLKEVMSAFARETGFRVAYDTKKISPGTTINITSSKLSPKTVLKLIKQQTGITYRAKGQYVILLPKFKERIFKTKRITEFELTRPPKVERNFTASAQRAVISTSDTVKTSITDTLHAMAIPDSIVGEENVSADDLYKLLSKPVNKIYYKSIPHYIYDVPLEPDRMKDKFLKEQFLFEVGITNNELFYVAPTANLGYKFLFLSGALYTHQNSAYWRLGINTSWQITPRIHLRAGYSMGRPFNASNQFTKQFQTVEPLPIDTAAGDTVSPGDTIIYSYNDYNIKIASEWNSLSLSAKYNFSRNFGIAAGITYNMLNNKYSINGLGGDQYNGLPSIPENEIPESITPPFNDKPVNSSNPLASNTKRWVGFQLTILFSF